MSVSVKQIFFFFLHPDIADSMNLLTLDVIDMLDVIMEGNEGEMEEFGPSLSEDLIIQTFPFSVLVPAALEARNKLPANKGKAVLPIKCWPWKTIVFSSW